MEGKVRVRVALTLEQFWHRVPGGTAVAAVEMARSLAHHDIDLVGVAARHDDPPDERWRVPFPIAHLRLPRPLLYESWHRLRTPRVERATGPVDVIHATTMATPPRTVPLVVTVHDLAWVDNPEHFTARGVRFFRRGFELVKRHADLVLCPSEATKRACSEHGIQPSRLRLVPLGVEVTPASDAEVERVKERYGLSRPYVMWTGTIEPRKNLEALARAFARVGDNHDLVLVGPKGWNQDLEQVIRPLGDRVKALGFVPPSDLAPLYAGASVFCYPSLLEGFGFPVLEAMAQGTPVVTSKGTSTEELARDAGVLVDPRDHASIAAGLGSLMDDPGYAEELSAAGRRRAAEYPWSRTAELLLDAYREVVA
ncbi:MAG: glycosyltransferase family 4 protein [Actinomycetota bacterium]|nr:glycosyltransferase family 4 protein [Actinomycetota bacterium]